MKKFLSMATVAVLSLSLLAGCGTTGGSGSSSSSGGEIKVGGLLELTGGVAEFGKKGENGIRLALEQQNAKGGVLGKQLKLITADNKSEAGESTAGATKLATEDKVVAIIGPMTTGNTLAAIPVITDNKIPLITPTGTNAKLTVNDGKLNSYVFRACFIDPFQGGVMAQYAQDTLKAKTAAFLVDQKGDYAIGLAKAFEDKFNGKIVAQEKYVADQDVDFRSQLTRIRAQNPDVVFVPGYYKEVGQIIKQGREMGMTQPFLGGDGWGTGPMLEVAGSTNLNNTFYSDHTAADDPALAAFNKDYKAKFGTEPDSFAALGYDAANMLIKAIETAGSAEPVKIRAALENLKDFQGVSGKMTVDPQTHNPQKSASILKFVDGKKVFEKRVDPK